MAGASSQLSQPQFYCVEGIWSHIILDLNAKMLHRDLFLCSRYRCKMFIWNLWLIWSVDCGLWSGISGIYIRAIYISDFTISPYLLHQVTNELHSNLYQVEYLCQSTTIIWLNIKNNSNALVDWRKSRFKFGRRYGVQGVRTILPAKANLKINIYHR